jgi:hypothetical protein
MTVGPQRYAQACVELAQAAARVRVNDNQKKGNAHPHAATELPPMYEKSEFMTVALRL